jgi:hypothetical protein
MEVFPKAGEAPTGGVLDFQLIMQCQGIGGLKITTATGEMNYEKTLPSLQML